MGHRWWMAIPLSFAVLSAASGEIANPCGAAAPSSFDYLVFASMADSPNPITMASYRPCPRETIPIGDKR